MASTSARSLQLLSLLQRKSLWTGAEFAARLEVSERTVRRDIERLRVLGYPIRASRGVGGGYILASDADVPPLLPDEDEAVTIVLGLQAVSGSISGAEGSASQALTKIIQLLPPRSRRRSEAVASQTASTRTTRRPVDGGVLVTLALACRDRTRVFFTYRPRAAPVAHRSVDPHGLVTVDTRWYLVAWDLDRHDWRTFRLDRLTDVQPTKTIFRPRTLPHQGASAYVRDSLSRAVTAIHEVEVLVEAPAEAVAREVGQWGAAEPLAPGRSRLRMRVDDLNWPAMVLGAVGAPFKVVRPSELNEHLRGIGMCFTAATAVRHAAGSPGGAVPDLS